MEVNLVNIIPFSTGLISPQTVWIILKWMAVLAMVMYCLFAAVIIKQVAIMSETLEDPANYAVKIIGWGHLLFAIALVLLMIVVL